MWWFCTHCEQYNGFNKDGDYRNEIPEMYDELNNVPQFCSIAAAAEPFSRNNNLLCAACMRNQNKLMQDMVKFVPSNEKFFDKECEEYEKYLNGKYRLCLSCKTTVMYYLQKQDQQIRTTHANEVWANVDNSPRKLNMNMQKSWAYLPLVNYISHVLSLIAGSWLFKQHKSSTNTDAVLYIASILSATVNMASSRSRNTFSRCSVIASVIWLITAMYGNYQTLDSNRFRDYMLVTLVILELLCVLHDTCTFVFKTWNKVAYMESRKRKVEQVRASPKNTRRTKCEQSDKEDLLQKVTPSVDEMFARKTEQISEKEQRQPEDVDPVTPDLLHGHLNAMYIERNIQQSSTIENERRETNHVVAALKYKLIHQPTSQSINKPLIRPATFILSSKVEPRENHAISAENNFKVPTSTTNVTDDIKEILVKPSQGLTPQPVSKKKVRKPLWIHLSCTNFLLIGFAVSIAFNIYFVVRLKVQN